MDRQMIRELIDSGHTLSYILSNLLSKNQDCVLMDAVNQIREELATRRAIMSSHEPTRHTSLPEELAGLVFDLEKDYFHLFGRGMQARISEIAEKLRSGDASAQPS